MRFIVRWLANALQKLAQVWLAAPDRNAITQATNRIDARLERDPHGESESRGGRDRVLFEAPLGVLFRIDETKRFVYVMSVWRFETRP